MSSHSALDAIAGGIVVSCQAAPGTPLADPTIIAALARASEVGGAVGLRIEGLADIRAVQQVSRLPIIGLVKVSYPDSSVYITPTAAEAADLIDTGVEIIALDATLRPRPRESLAEIVRMIRSASDALVMADVSTLAEGLSALELGVDIVGTTLHGYTPESGPSDGPAFRLIEDLAAAGGWVVAEGRVWTPKDVAHCYDAGARSVVVGGAVTDPISITRRLTRAAMASTGEKVRP